MSVRHEDYDLVVVGAGNAALSSAIAAKEEGLNVLVLEKGPKEKRGGNSFFTDGAIRFAYEDMNTLASILSGITKDDIKDIEMPEYRSEDYYDDIMRLTQGKSEPALAKQLVSKSLETISWMRDQGVEFQLNENQRFEKDGKYIFWGGLPVKTKQKGIGLIETLNQRMEVLGIEVLYSTRAIKIDTQEDRVKAVIVQQDGHEKRIPTKAVVLACGGFEASKEKRKKHMGSEWENAVVRGSEYNTGDGLDMALAVGAVPYGDWSGCHAHTTDYGSPRVGDYSKPGDIYKKSSYPLGLIVNIKAERFVDEGADFRNYTYAKYGKETLKQPEQKAFQLFDSQVRPMLREEYNLEEATYVKADTITELAKKMDVDPKALEKTVMKYNDVVQEGTYNPSIKDGKGTTGITPPKSNWALKFDHPPFYAYPVTCGITFTFGGIHVNNMGAVLDKNENPIAGLFAAGEMVGGLFFDNYPGGSGLMSGAVFGRLAGCSAADYVNKSTAKQ
ncbi:FAD-dependent tricarballylate dehydrogenase TcuA [Salicibibacter kimchii]|uniref:FAD-binding dehydrogenase n=1 Tax=Salicibibacter kimchii TaxID=2099786 RepID=A0A345BXN0_9BACI|nr:FAD-dependent tricarballylate dehydrogenase TcuA [Salicibibacter kimchii]AXF55711.1 FAD-binding dehydrogenase [Salicibibacter kimchii]